MTNPNLNVDHEELIQLADGHVVLIDELAGGGGPPQITVKGEWASAAAAQAVLGANETAKASMVSRLGSNADSLRAGANGYQGQEAASGVKLGEISQLVGSIVQPVSQTAGSVVGAVSGAFGAMVGAVANPVNGVVGAVSSATIGKSQNQHEPRPDVGPDTGLLGQPSDGEKPQPQPQPLGEPERRVHAR